MVMKDMKGVVKNIIEHGVGKIPWCILGSKEENSQFTCLYSSLEEYKIGHLYSLYEIQPLERLLAKKNKLLNEKVLKKIYREDNSKILSYIVNWDKSEKLVLLLQINNPFTKPEQVKETLNIIEKNRGHISELFRKQENDYDREEFTLDG